MGAASEVLGRYGAVAEDTGIEMADGNTGADGVGITETSMN